MRSIGYIIIAQQKNRRGVDGTPLAYGSAGMPGPDELLSDRGATLFGDIDAAREALTDTCRKCEARGASWHRERAFCFVPVLIEDDDG